jgi:hypothetical protein
MEKIITEQQDVIVNRNNDLYMTKNIENILDRFVLYRSNARTENF